ncbi:alpha/beta fold hydrolase [Pseudomonas sp. LS1212]|uniref:alpha/beta fold hydrolase n=1 Tax=Pseudomonas sp. LS1212 TaxID=2972478 RepID=UPI00215D3E48|nr:alpha/beta fold hydrolase [Pseudomonas sp. LS1212]UVJ45626.1 alpha/beta fold hydrolase [Pseudomonas sp. LS1212]
MIYFSHPASVRLQRRFWKRGSIQSWRKEIRVSEIERTPVIFINGLIGTLRDPEIHRQLGGRPSLAPDLLGYGALRNASVHEITINTQVERIREAIEEHFDKHPVHLVGHSVGGVVAYLFAQRYPERVVSIISVEGNFTLKDAFWSSSVAQMTQEEAEAMLAGFQADPGAWLARSGIPDQPEKLSTARTWLENQPASTLQAMAKSVVVITEKPDYHTALKELFAAVPVYLLAGEHSVGDWDIPGWAKHEVVSLTIMPKAGHLMMLENPGAFGRIIAELLD